VPALGVFPGWALHVAITLLGHFRSVLGSRLT
jgi:hypothetical protein